MALSPALPQSNSDALIWTSTATRRGQSRNPVTPSSPFTAPQSPSPRSTPGTRTRNVSSATVPRRQSNPRSTSDKMLERGPDASSHRLSVTFFPSRPLSSSSQAKVTPDFESNESRRESNLDEGFPDSEESVLDNGNHLLDSRKCSSVRRLHGISEWGRRISLGHLVGRRASRQANKRSSPRATEANGRASDKKSEIVSEVADVTKNGLQADRTYGSPAATTSHAARSLLSLNRRGMDLKRSLQSNDQGERNKDGDDQTDKEHEGFYRWSKRRLMRRKRRGGDRIDRDKDGLGETNSLNSETHVRLEQVTHWLCLLLNDNHEGKAAREGSGLRRKRSQGSLLHQFSNDDSARRGRKLPQRDTSVLSCSSSILNLMQGDSPHNSPDQTHMYRSHDQKQFLKVEIANPEGPAFLPSEATRLGTPPLPSEKGNNSRRGYFFDFNAPSSDQDANHEGEPSKFADPAEMRPDDLKRIDSLAKFYGVRLNEQAFAAVADEEEEEEEADDKWKEVELPDAHVPEHLPNSPLCPASPRHSSGGRKECIYHGRGKEYSNAEISPFIESTTLTSKPIDII